MYFDIRQNDQMSGERSAWKKYCDRVYAHFGATYTQERGTSRLDYCH